MKKLVLFAAVVASLAFVSCGGGKKDVVDSTAILDSIRIADSIANAQVAPIVIDSAAIKATADSLAKVAEAAAKK